MLEGSSMDAPRIHLGWFKGSSRMLENTIMKQSWWFNYSNVRFKDASRMPQWCLNDASNIHQRYLPQCVSQRFCTKMLQGWLRVLQG